MKNFTPFKSLIAVTLLTTTLRASEPNTLVELVRPLGMGGAFTAVADDHNIFTYNPAGLVQRTGSQFTLVEIAAGVSKDSQDVFDFVQDNKDQLNNWDDLTFQQQQDLTNKILALDNIDPRVYVAGNGATYLSGPNFLGLPFHVAFGGMGVVDSSFEIRKGAGPVPFLNFEINSDVVVPITIAHRWDAPLLPGKIGVGLTGKYIVRNQVRQQHVSLLQFDGEDIEAPPVAQGKGIGSDLGFLYQPSDRTNIGVMIQDFLGTKLSFDAEPGKNGFVGYTDHDSVIRPRTNIGYATTPDKLLWFLPTGDRWTLAADVRDILSDDEHILFQRGFSKILGEHLYKHVHLGAEFRYWFLRFRGGAYQGYPTAGLGLDIPLLKLDFAYYGREIGALAGDRRQDNYVASLALSFGGSKVEARDRIQSKKEMKNKREMSMPEESNVPSNTVTEPAGNTGPADAGDIPQ